MRQAAGYVAVAALCMLAFGCAGPTAASDAREAANVVRVSLNAIAEAANGAGDGVEAYCQLPGADHGLCGRLVDAHDAVTLAVGQARRAVDVFEHVAAETPAGALVHDVQIAAVDAVDRCEALVRALEGELEKARGALP